MTLRSAQATLEDGRVFARYLDVAAEGFITVLLGGKAHEIAAEAFVEGGHDMSYEHVTFAERDGAVLGMLSAYTAEQHRASSHKPLMRAAGVRILRVWAIAMLCWRFLRFMETMESQDFYVQAVAVDSEARGAGVGSALLDHAESCGREAGCARLALDVASTNEGALRLYKRRGMIETARSPAIGFVGGVRAIRMTKPL